MILSTGNNMVRRNKFVSSVMALPFLCSVWLMSSPQPAFVVHAFTTVKQTTTSTPSLVSSSSLSLLSNDSVYNQWNNAMPLQQPDSSFGPTTTTTTTALSAVPSLRRWNLNRQEGSSPFGLDLNAEVWNGRVAQVAFTWVFLQEWIQGKGVLKGLSDGDFINMISAAVFAILIAAITVRFVLEPPAGGGVALDNRSRRSSIPYNSQQQQTSSSSGSYEMRTSRKLANPDEDEDNMLVNFNNGNSPFGLKANAEIWNGRIAMFSFVWVVVQEFVMGEGFVSAIERGDTGALAALGAELMTVMGFTIAMASVTDDYVERVVGVDSLRNNARNPNTWMPATVDPPYEQPDVVSVAPGTGVSDPVTYEMYMRERAIVEARNKAEKDASWASSFSNSLKAMSSSDQESVSSAPGFQVFAAKNPKPAWSGTQPSSYAPVRPAMVAKDTSPMSLPFGSAYSPVVVKAGTSASIEYPQETAKSFSVTEVAVPVTTASVSATQVAEVSSMPTGNSINFNSGRVAAPPIAGNSYLSGLSSAPLNRVDPSPHPGGDFKFQAATQALVRARDEAVVARPKPAVTFRVDGYRFKPETQSAIGSTPHPGGSFIFNSNTSEMIKTNVPKSKPVAYPVEGFKFGENTKSFIQATERTAVVAPEVAVMNASTESAPTMPQRQQQQQQQQPIVSPSFSNVDVVPSYGNAGMEQPMNSLPVGNAASRPYQGFSGSYLDALSRSDKDSAIGRNVSSFDNGSNSGAVEERDMAPPELVGTFRTPVRSGSYLDSLGQGLEWNKKP